MKKIKHIIKNLLLVFVLISVGFALGKHRTGAHETISPAIPEVMHETVNVYYMHATFRCVTCNAIEKMTRQLLDAKYKKLLTAGIIKFAEVDFQKNEPLAKQFDISSSCVVAAKIKDGKIIQHERLDKVWELLNSPAEFDAYISQAINRLLPTDTIRQGGEK